MKKYPKFKISAASAAPAEGGAPEKRRFFGEGGREPSREDKERIGSNFGQILVEYVRGRRTTNHESGTP